MAKVTIMRRKEQRADGRAALYAVVYLQGNKLRIPLDIAVKSGEWNSEKGQLRGTGKDAQDKNLIILKVKSKITDILVRARLNGISLTKEKFLAMYHRPGETLNFNEYAAQHLHDLRLALQPATLRHHRSVLAKVAAYAPDLELGDITPEWLQTYAAYLRKRYNNNLGTIGKNMSVIRMHYYAAMRAGKVIDNPFEVYKIPRSEPAVVYLNEREFLRLTALYKSGKLDGVELEVLRFFLFMAFTAMHISDARALQIEQIYDGEIHYCRQKTRIRVSMPVSKPAAELIDYYKGFRHRGNLFVGLPSDQAVNRIIKQVCKSVGINKPVSAKTGRHTFATLYYIKNSGDLGTLSKLLGHTSVTTTMIYAHILKDSRVAGVKAFDEML